MIDKACYIAIKTGSKYSKQLEKIGGKSGNIALTASTILDWNAFKNGEISGRRFSYRLTGNIIGKLVQVFGPEAPIATEVFFGSGESVYDFSRDYYYQLENSARSTFMPSQY